MESKQWPETKRKIVDAGVRRMRSRGFNSTSLDDICREAGVTKGGFFHYFKNKDDLARAAVLRFAEGKTRVFGKAPFRSFADPLDRVFGRLDFALESAGGGKGLTKGCLIGMFAQEMSSASPELRAVCHEIFSRIAADFQKDLAQAKALHAPRAAFDPGALAAFYVSTVQGSMLMAKASGSNSILAENLRQFRAYLQTLHGAPGKPSGKRGRRALPAEPV